MKNLNETEEQLSQIEEMGGVRELGCVGVDSGQLLITDPCYIDGHWEKEKFEGNSGDYFNYSYLGCCNQTLKSGGGEIFGLNREGLGYSGGHLSDISLGTVFSTGHGDGCYPVYGKTNDHGRIMGVLIDFGMNEEEGFLDEDEVEEMLS